MRLRKGQLPHPAVPALRGWVLELSPEVMHREVCARLRGRTVLLAEGFAAWSLAGYPGWSRADRAMPFGLRLRLAQRLTIISPMVRVGVRSFPLLPSGRLTDPELPRPVPHTPNADQLTMHNVIAVFQRAVIDKWWMPLPSDVDLLEEYERLRAALAAWRPRDRRLWLALRGRGGGGREIRIAGTLYRLPGPHACTMDPKPAPSRAAALLLAIKDHTNERLIRARLPRARVERRIAGAWETYSTYLTAQPAARAEFDRVFPGITQQSEPTGQSLSSLPFLPKFPASGV